MNILNKSYLKSMRKYKLFVFFLLALTLKLNFCSDYFLLSTSQNPANQIGLSLLDIQQLRFIKVAYHPSFKIDNLDLTLDLNLYLPLTDKSYSHLELGALNLRYIQYKHAQQYGFQAGRIHNLTFGQGLLVNRFDTGLGSSDYHMQDMGFLGYAMSKPYHIQMFWSLENIQGFHVQYHRNNVRQLQLSAAYMADSDGYTDSSTGLSLSRPIQSGIAASVQAQLYSELLQGYISAAKLHSRGNAYGLGIKGDFWSILRYRLGYRFLEKGFIPGYFNRSYYSSPFSYESDFLQEKQQGMIVGLSTRAMQGLVDAGFEYEAYKKQQSLNAGLRWQTLFQSSAALNYIVPLQGYDNRMLTLAINYHKHKDQTFFLKYTFINNEPDDTQHIHLGLKSDVNVLKRWWQSKQ
eukprot:COSAG01_NODE_165_length_23303_cov_269.524953_10_plen_405_part_00